MLEVQDESPDYILVGLTAMPIETRANRNAVTVLVNGRYVRSQAVVQPLMQAYHTLLPLHRYPLTVIELKMHPSLVDVNVHPAKLEVRFSKENELRSFVESAIKKALGSEAYIPSGAATRTPKTNTWVQDQIRFQVPAEAVSPTQPIVAEPRSEYEVSTPISSSPSYPAKSEPASPVGRTAGYNSDRASSVRWTEKPVAEKIPEQVWERAFAQPDRKPQAPEFPELSWIGQLHGTYIVAQNPTGLYLIDQHAAHERIHYEFYYDKFGRPEEASQELLLPVTLEFAPDEATVLRGRLAAFQSAGVYMEDFGGNTFIIRAVPHWFPGGDEAAIVREMAEWVIQERSVDLHALREKAAIMCSCKASIKANQALTRESGEKLLERLAACRQPYTCPHGRPIVVSFSSYELEKMFKRVTS
jgi:DNA mismatch repair protein MutL